MTRTIGARIRQAREAAAMTQSGLAAALGLSNRSVVNNWETGANRPGVRALEEVAAALNTTPEFLAFGHVCGEE